MICTLRKLSVNGDDVVAKWDTDTVAPERLREIELEFRAYQAKGYFAADLTDGRNKLVHDFDPEANILLMPRVMGG